MNSISLVRTKDDGERTRGIALVLDETGTELLKVQTIELPWRDNRQRVSCIPEGRYKVVKRWSPKFKDHLHILDVPGRSYILIHPANFAHELHGCVAPGMTGTATSVGESRVAMSRILELLGDESEIVISSL